MLIIILWTAACMLYPLHNEGGVECGVGQGGVGWGNAIHFCNRFLSNQTQT